MTEGGKPAKPVRLFLAGDVMLGRGIDQILPHPGDPALAEPYMTSALQYVALAEAANGPILWPAGWDYVWGDALAELAARQPDVRIINLETAVTRAMEPVPKGINYKINPDNAPVLAAAGIDCCVLANNHVLDWGIAGLLDTLDSLQAAGVAAAGAGRDLEEACAPAVLPVSEQNRVLVFGFAVATAGIPAHWAATAQTPGVNFLPDFSERTMDAIAGQVRAAKRPDDIAIASIHWGGNWGYAIGPEDIAFAHRLVDEAAIDIVHGHSSHHVKALEAYRGRPILYGCGDFLSDYEGITGYEMYRDDLALMYFPTLQPGAPQPLVELVMVPLQMRKFRLNRASQEDADWIYRILTREAGRFGAGIERLADGSFRLVWETT